jgi:flavin-dependent dehydrogenase
VHTTAVKPAAGIDFLVAHRRRLLDNLILDAAVAAGAEVRLGISVGDVIRDDDGRVTGVTGRAADGTTVTVRARLVIGADGMRSRIARAVDAPIVEELVIDTGAYFTYFDSIPWEGFEFYIADRALTGVFPTNDEAACVWVVASGDAIAAVRAAHGADDVGFHQLVLRTAPDLAHRLVDARVVEHTRIALRYPSFVRHPVGAGWALVGDAGYYRDAITGHGITDAFRDADLLAAVVGEWLRGGQPETVALHWYASEREAGLRPIFDITNALAAWPGPEPFFGLQKDLNHLLDIEADRFASAPPPPASTATSA